MKKGMTQLINNGIILADKVKYCDDIFSRTKGLMFSRPLTRGQGLILVADEESIYQTTIHMLFVFFGIDVVWLNSNKEVVDIKQKVKSFEPFIAPRSPAKYILELPVGTAKHIKIGDRIEFT